MNFELGVTVAALIKTESFKLVVAGHERQCVHQHVAPDVSGCVLGAVDADERACAVVSVL